MLVQNPIPKTVSHRQTAGKRKRRKRNGLSSHDMDSWWIIHPLLWTTSLGSDPSRSQPRPFHRPILLLRERYLSLPHYTISQCLSTWVGGPRVAPGLSVTKTALCSRGGEIKSHRRRQQRTTGVHRAKIKDPSHIFPPCALNKHCNPWNQMLLM